MHNLLVPVETETGRRYIVLKHYLTPLIQQRKIKRFRRSGEWVDADADQRRIDSKAYQGIERRFLNRIDPAVLPMPIDQQLTKGYALEAILGFGEKAQEIAAKLKNVAKTNLSVLIQGKTGTGKGVAALILHELSTRREKPFVRVDCGAIPPTLIESELFGYERGSFTGAFRSKPGRFQLANGGTIFLDEIANLNIEMQTRLLGFLEERVVSSIGGVRSVKLDVRIISATNADLVDHVRKYQFREDLYYRLNEYEVHMPPLRDRSDDLFFLATKFLAMANAELKKNIVGFSEEAIDFLSHYEWQGNIRELKNRIKRAALLAEDVVDVEHLLGFSVGSEAMESLDAYLENALAKGGSLHETIDAIRKIAERKIIERVYTQCGGNKRKTREALGIDYSTLYRKMKGYGML